MKQPAKKGRTYRVWIGRFKLGRRTLYAKTVASTRAECQALIDEGGPFYNTEPMRATLVLDPPPPRKRKT